MLYHLLTYIFHYISLRSRAIRRLVVWGKSERSESVEGRSEGRQDEDKGKDKKRKAEADEEKGKAASEPMACINGKMTNLRMYILKRRFNFLHLYAGQGDPLGKAAAVESRPEDRLKPVGTIENPPPSDHPEHLSAWELPEVETGRSPGEWTRDKGRLTTKETEGPDQTEEEVVQATAASKAKPKRETKAEVDQDEYTYEYEADSNADQAEAKEDTKVEDRSDFAPAELGHQRQD
eukprot:s4907_g6.t1